jgi:hypothetical protein
MLVRPKGKVRRIYPIDDAAFNYLQSLTLGPDGNLWFASPTNGEIGRLSLP